MLFSVLVSISVHLSWPGISSVIVGIHASVLVVQLKHCQFLLEIPLWGSYLPFHGYVAFEYIVSLWLAQAFHLFPPSHFSVVLTWAAMSGGWGSVLEVSLLLSHSLVWWGVCHLPFHPLQRTLLALVMCVCSSRNYCVSWCAWDVLTASGKMASLQVEVVLEGWGSVHPQEICFTFEFLCLSGGGRAVDLKRLLFGGSEMLLRAVWSSWDWLSWWQDTKPQRCWSTSAACMHTIFLWR